MGASLGQLPLSLALLAAAALGLAPFLPEPHVREKAKMLRAGTLRRPLDIFDLLLHLAPFLLLAAKLARMGVAGLICAFSGCYAPGFSARFGHSISDGPHVRNGHITAAGARVQDWSGRFR